MSLRAVSSGGGRQSTALLVLAVKGIIDFPLFIFSNVGEQAENPETLTYLRNYSIPFAEANGIEFVERQWVTRKGEARDLYVDLIRQERSVNIPVRLKSGAFGNRQCTARYKIEVVGRELRKRGATPENPAVVAIGISTDEISRAKTGVPQQQPWTTRVNPLIDLNISSRECLRIVREAGLPVPPKSSCSFCPFQGVSQWRHQRDTNPELYKRNCELDQLLSQRHERLRGDRAGLLHATLPLSVVVESGDDQLSFEGMCDVGSCMT